MRKKRLYMRRFLNRRGHHAGAYILASVEDTSKDKSDYGSPWIEFTIADCGRQISLDFDVDDKELANSLYKIDTLVDALTKLREALVEEGALEAEREAKRKAERAAKKKASKKATASV